MTRGRHCFSTQFSFKSLFSGSGSYLPPDGAAILQEFEQAKRETTRVTALFEGSARFFSLSLNLLYIPEEKAL
jgi:hypothetical protein